MEVFVGRFEQRNPRELHGYGCAHCGNSLSLGASILCRCRSCVYCSLNCRFAHESGHLGRCERLHQMLVDLRQRLTDLQAATVEASTGVIGLSVDRLFHISFPANISDMSWETTNILMAKRDEYLNSKGVLIEELIYEGQQRPSGNDKGEIIPNRFAIDTAQLQWKDLLALRLHDPDIVVNYMYLLMGRFQEMYDLSCFFARKGSENLAHHELKPILTDCIQHQNITRSYFKAGAESGNFYVNFGSFHETALWHMFLVKYLLHMNMMNLHLINKHLLGNQDCMDLIGEYAGMKKEWIVRKNTMIYQDQAFEVLRVMRCHVIYSGSHNLSCFDKARKFAELNFPGDLGCLVDDALITGMNQYMIISGSHTINRALSGSKWDKVVRSYEANHSIIYTSNIRPVLPWAVKKINDIAGYHIMGMNVDKDLGVTQFITETIIACHSRFDLFIEVVVFLDAWEEDEDDLLAMEYKEFEKCGTFSDAASTCVFIEKKLAQCFFHKAKFSDKAEKILRQLPGDIESYRSYPPADDSCCGRPDEYWYDTWLGDIMNDHLQKCAPEVTKVIDALYKMDMATDENLIHLFGNSGFASYRIWHLQQLKEKSTQPRIESFLTRKRLWIEGCTDNDTELGLKIKYLNKTDREQRYGEIRGLVPVAKFIGYLEPSLGQFVNKFGWKKLGIDPYQYGLGVGDIIDMLNGKELMGSASKKCRSLLDGFLTAEEACRHFFDSSSIEEAIWDLVGVPRLVVLNGDKDTMSKSGWKLCGAKHILGEKSVQLGSRVAYMYCDSLKTNGPCTIWEETSSIDDEMETD